MDAETAKAGVKTKLQVFCFPGLFSDCKMMFPAAHALVMSSGVNTPALLSYYLINHWAAGCLLEEDGTLSPALQRGNGGTEESEVTHLRLFSR